MLIAAALGMQRPQRLVQTQQIGAVQAAGALGAVNVRGERGDVLRPGELVVVGRADVDLPGRGSVGVSEATCLIKGRWTGRGWFAPVIRKGKRRQGDFVSLLLLGITYQRADGVGLRG